MAKNSAPKEKVKNSVKFTDSIKTKLIFAMILAAALPLIVSILVSYKSSTNKALEDAEVSLNWQAHYIERKFGNIIDSNINMIRSLAGNPTIINFVTGDADIPLDAVVATLQACDAILDDGDTTVIAGPDGVQLARSKGDLLDVSDREYFKQAMAGNIFVSNVQISKSNGRRMITFACPILVDGKPVGIVHRNYDLNNFHEMLAAEAEDAFLCDRDGLVAAHSQYEIGEGAHEEDDRSKSTFMTSGLDEGFYLVDTKKGYDAYVSYVVEPKTQYRVVAASDSKQTMAAARKSAQMVMIAGGVLLIIAIIASLFMAKNFTEPIAAVGKTLKALADGHFVRVDKHDTRKDEFGEISRDTNSVIEKLGEIVSNIKESASNVGESSEELSDMANQISQTAEDVSNAVQEIASGATQQADEIQSASENVGRIGDAVTDVQSSTSDLEGLAGKMKEASEVSSESLSNLQESSTAMTSKIDEISATIQRTQDAVNNISEKVEGITSIATQTNLLSLNASIEAARAGEAGKGFSVVAEEIGKLAEDSKTMADDIKKEMGVLLEEAKDAVRAAQEVKDANLEQQASLGETIQSISGMIADIDNTVGGVQTISTGADTCESSKNAVVDTMSALSAISEENAASSEETGASMQELSATVTTLAGSANNLKDIADKLNEDMKFFK